MFYVTPLYLVTPLVHVHTYINICSNIICYNISSVDGDNFFPPESTMSAQPFITPDFTISTSCAVVVHVTANGTIADVLLREHDAAVNALAAHPNLPHLLIGSFSCKLKLWNYQTK